MRKTQHVFGRVNWFFTLFILLSQHGLIFSQVSIRDRIVIAPGQSAIGYAPLNLGSDTSECTICYVNQAMIYQETGADGVFFDSSGTFQLQTGFPQPVRLHGGRLAGINLENSPQFGVGADDYLNIDINGTRVVSYSFYPYFHFYDPADTGIAITPYVHDGANTFHAVAGDNYLNEDYGVPQLRITLPASGRFRVTFTPDTTKYTDSSKIVVTAVDANNNPVVIPDATQLMFTIEQSDSIWGYFVDPSGIFRDSPLQNVTYGDARAGKVLFVSNGWIDSLGGLRPVNVRVEGGLRVGVGSIYLGTVRLKFDGPDSADVYPHWDGHNNTAATVDTLGLILKSVYGSTSIPAKNVLVRIGPPTLVDSGGHSHFSHVVPKTSRQIPSEIRV